MRVGNLAGAASAVLALSLAAAAPVPRNAPELTIAEQGGRHSELSSFKGKVVVIEFLLTRCPHCWRLAQTIGKLHRELGPCGFQAIGIAFDQDLSEPAVAGFVAASRIAFPVGYATSDKVDAFLGREQNERLQVPQIVVIDRAGVIRAQSRPAGETKLEDEVHLRELIESLLAQHTPA